MPQPFMPVDRPKSWVVAVLTGATAVLVFAPLLLLAYFLKLPRPVVSIPFFGFVGCIAVCTSMWVVLRIKHSSQGNYVVPAKPWNEQVW